MKIGSAIFTIGADHAEFTKKIDAAHEKVGELAKGMQTAGSKMVTAGSRVSMGLLPVTSAITDIAKASLGAAMSTEESLNKVRVVFGAAAGDIEAFAKDSARNLGLSRQRALEAAGTFGNLFTAMGIGRPAAAGMSKDILTLAADLASFNNIDPTEALDKLRAGLVGETEPLRALGVNLSAARIAAEALRLELVKGVADDTKVAAARLNVEQATLKWTAAVKAGGQESLAARDAGLALTKAEEALEKALAGTIPELTAAQKATAALSLITADTKNAQGDFKNTSDGLANSLRIQKAEQENVQAQLGLALIPVMREATKVIMGITGAFAGLSPEMQNAVMIGGGLLLVLGPMLTVIGVITTALGLFMAMMVPTTGSIWATTVAVGALNIALGPLLLGIAAVALAVLLLKLAWDSNLGDIQGKTAAVLAFVTARFEEWRTFFTGLWEGIKGPVTTAIAVITAPIQSLINIVQTAISWLGRLSGARASADMSTASPNAAAAVRGYQHGTSFVPSTGLALLHRGEAVIPAAQNPFPSGGAVPPTQTINLVVDGRVLASVVNDRFNTQRRIAGGLA